MGMLFMFRVSVIGRIFCTVCLKIYGAKIATVRSECILCMGRVNIPSGFHQSTTISMLLAIGQLSLPFGGTNIAHGGSYQPKIYVIVGFSSTRPQVQSHLIGAPGLLSY